MVSVPFAVPPKSPVPGASRPGRGRPGRPNLRGREYGAMNKHIWTGGLFLSLCGWACQAGAQEGPWGAPRPAGAVPPACVAETPGATLGRPVAAPADAPSIDPGVVPASYREP